ncbi:MAG: regulatory protein RecX [Oceanihabitans sp.]|nr:regulatory protein RecX [Oceanihabitans sp.]
MNLQRTYSLDEARKKLEFYCAYQERSHKEVVTKLKDMRMIPDAIDVIVVHLIQNNFLNEERFAKAFVRGKFRIKKWGKNRLKLELKRKDITKTIIDIALKEIDADDYLETFYALAEKKAESIQEPNSYKKKKKLADYLLYRGWESPLVYDVVHTLIE